MSTPEPMITEASRMFRGLRGLGGGFATGGCLPISSAAVRVKEVTAYVRADPPDGVRE
jgi:hypothetical protein